MALGSSSIVNEKYEKYEKYEIRDYFYHSKKNTKRKNTKYEELRFSFWPGIRDVLRSFNFHDPQIRSPQFLRNPDPKPQPYPNRVFQEQYKLADYSSKNSRWWWKKSIGDLGSNSFPAPICACGSWNQTGNEIRHENINAFCHETKNEVTSFHFISK